MIPFQEGAQPNLSPPVLAGWSAVLARFGFMSLGPIVTDVSGADLQRLVDDASQANPGEIIPNPMLCFAIAVPDDALPDPGTVARSLVLALSVLPFVEFAIIEDVMTNAVNRLDNPHALFQLYLNPSPVGIDAEAAWAAPGGDGTGVQVGVLEVVDYDRAHRDMPVRRRNLTPQLGQSGDIDLGHATAILGILGAADNTHDCVGIAPGASFVFASGQDSGKLDTGLGFNLINLLGVQLQPGDVLNIATHMPPRTIEANPIIHSAIRLLTFRRITVVIAAGNSAVNFDTAGIAVSDSGAVVVGGITPTNPQGTAFARDPLSNSGSRVDCCAWASNVTTLATPRPDIGGSFVETLVGNDGGTSLSTAIISGVVATIQAHSLAKNGHTLRPHQVRTILRNPSLCTSVVPGAAIRAMPDLAKIIPTL